MSDQDVVVAKPGETRTRRPKAMTQAAILDRAYDMYLSRELVHGDERLSLVLDSLGYTTGAGYQIWPNQAAFRLDLQVYIAERIDYAGLEPLVEQFQVIREQKLDRHENGLAIANLYFDLFSTCEEFFLVLRFYAMGEDRPPEVTEALRGGYERLSGQIGGALAAAWTRYDRRLKPNRTIEQLAATITALAEGFALRSRVGADVPLIQDGEATHHPFAVAFQAVVEDYTEDDV